MSALDLPKIVDSLQLKKVKQRNDSLQLLRSFSVAKLKLTPRHFVVLLEGILKLIEIERDVYGNNPTSATHQRLLTASTMLKDILEESLKRGQLRYKHCTSLFFSVISSFFLPETHSILAPCAIDFAKILQSLLREPFFLTHLPIDSWNRGYKFLVRLLTAALDTTEHHDYQFSHESLLTDLLSSLHYIIGGATKDIYEPLKRLKVYVPLRKILSDVFEIYNKRESSVLVEAFKVTNKLLITLTSEDFSFCHKLIHTALQPLINFAHTMVDGILMQFVIFLNLESFHRYLNIDSLPKLITNELVEDSSEEESSTRKRLDPFSTSTHQGETSKYNIGVLAQALLDRIAGLNHKLLESDIDFEEIETAKSWFDLASIRLKTGQDVQWLLLRGTARLIVAYYNLCMEETYSNFNQSFLSSKLKRVKLQGTDLSIKSFESMDALLKHMIGLSKDVRLQTLGLQLLIFTKDSQTIDRSLQLDKKGSHLENDVTNNNDETTVIDVHLDEDVNPGDEDCNFLSQLIKCFNNRDLMFWCLLGIFTILRRLELARCYDDQMITRRLHQVIRIVTPMIKLDDHSRLSCRVISFILFSYHPDRLYRLVDHSLRSQLQNLLEMAEMNGPSSLHCDAFRYWWALHWSMTKLTNAKSEIINRAAGRWFLSKLNDELSPTNPRTRSEPNRAQMIGSFVLWLLGIDVHNLPFKSGDSDKRDQLIFHLGSAVDNSDFDKFLDLKNVSLKRLVHKPKIITCDGNTDMIASIFDRVNFISSRLMVGSVGIDRLFHWTEIVTHIREAFRVREQNIPLAIEETCEKLWRCLFMNLSSQEDYAIIMKLLLLSDLDEPLAIDKPFVFRQLEHFIFGLNSLSQTAGPSGSNETEFEEEFLNNGSSKATPLPQLPQLATETMTLYIRLLVKFDGDITLLLTALDVCDPATTLQCISILCHSPLVSKMSSEEAVRVIRMLGEGPLSSHQMDRSSDTVFVTSKLLKNLLPLIDGNDETDFRKDFTDLLGFLLQCEEKLLFLIESCRFNVISLIFECLTFHFELSSGAETANRALLPSSNSLRVSLLDSVRLYLNSMNSFDQLELYRSLFETFPHPQGSVERAAAYCFFFTTISSGTTQIKIPAIFNLLECHKYDFFAPYLKLGLSRLCLGPPLCSPRQLFQSMRMELLKSWWHNEIPLETFPYELFDYIDFKAFAVENYREIVSICMAIKSQRSASQIVSQLSQVSKYKGYDIQNMLYDSLPILIPLAYTSNGVRNEVFKSLLPYLNNLYKGYMREKVLLIILETLRLTDTGSEIALSEVLFKTTTVDLFMSSIRLDNSMRATLTPVSSIDLIRALISKFWPSERGDFWTTKVCYFMIRQLGRDVLSEDPDLQLMALRKIKLVVSQVPSGLKDPNVISLVIELCTLLVGSRVAHEGDVLISQISVEDMESFGQAHLLFTIAKLFNRLMNENKEDLYRTFVERIAHMCHYSPNLLGAFSNLFSNCAIKLFGGSVAANVEELETILQHLSEKVSSDEILNCIIELLMRLYHDTQIPNPKRAEEYVVRLFMNIDFLQTKSNMFVIWVAKYLSFYYLHCTKMGDISGLIKKSEFEKTSSEAFLLKCSSLNFFVQQIVKMLRWSGYQEKAFAECILSALLWKFDARKPDSEKFVDFKAFVDDIGDFLTPMDFHSSILVISEKSHPTKGNDGLSQVIESLRSRVIADNFTEWSSQLMLAIFQEIARYTSIASLFAICILKFPQLAAESLPHLVCYYLFLLDLKSLPIISALIENMVSCDAYLGAKGLDLLARIVICVRIGSKQEGGIYQRLYSKLNLEKVYLVLKDSMHSKTALLVLEDATQGKGSNVDWVKWRTSILKIYESVDDLDMLYGVPQEPTLSNTVHMLKRIASTSEILRNDLAILDSAALRNEANDDNATAKSLLADGLMGMSRVFSLNSTGETGCYEWSWKLSKWNIPLSEQPNSDHEIIYNYFKGLRVMLDTSDCLHKAISNSFRQKRIISDGKLSHRSNRQLYQRWFVTLSSLTEVDDILRTPEDQILTNIRKFSHLSSWFEDADIDNLENILLCRREAFRLRIDGLSSKISILESNEAQSICWQGLIHGILTYNAVARLNNHSQKMLNSAVLMDEYTSHLSGLIDWQTISNFVSFSIAQTLWTQGNSTAPIAMLKSLVSQEAIGSSAQDLLHLDQRMIVSHLVSWLADSREELGENLLRQYVEPMESGLSEIGDSKQRFESFLLLARFCEKQFKASALKTQISNLKLRIKVKKDEIEVIKLHYGKTAVTPSERKSVQKYYNRLKAQVATDSIDLQSLEDTTMTFGCKSVMFYLSALLASDEGQENEDRFISLYLELSSYQPLHASLKQNLQSLPSYKALSWSTQLMARLSSDDSEFQNSIQQLIIKLCFDHPFHTLHMLISLLYHKEVAQDTGNNIMLLRVNAAEQIWQKLMAEDEKFSKNILHPIEKLCEESNILAKHKSSRGRALHLDKLEIGKYWLHDLPQIPPPTLNIPVSKNGYKDIPRMVSFDPKVSIATSGLSLPKIAKFTLSDGSSRKMLLKYGTDDLRQDATMEQVFEKVNTILERDRETRKRKLHVRTYKAIPLGPKAGVIEFVPNSKALIEVIKPYHQRQDKLKYEKAKEAMKDCQSSTLKERLQTYETITAKIDPVLHQYFSDHFVTPDDWYESRQKFTRGIASSSMVGHILGLGDRHCNNILLDETTGEPVHIDLGVAFDQGKRLPIPETVPFRLTRDIVDGFGFTGVHGVFDKLCEHTFRVLREHKEHIIAILDALRWDPLYLWSISPLRKKRLQDDTKVPLPEPQEDGSEANAAVLTVLEKVDAGGLSVEATVRQLIREATSPENLALIYCGWCPFF